MLSKQTRHTIHKINTMNTSSHTQNTMVRGKGKIQCAEYSPQHFRAPVPLTKSNYSNGVNSDQVRPWVLGGL